MGTSFTLSLPKLPDEPSLLTIRYNGRIVHHRMGMRDRLASSNPRPIREPDATSAALPEALTQDRQGVREYLRARQERTDVAGTGQGNGLS